MTERRRRRLWTTLDPRKELLLGLIAVALLTMHAWRDAIVLAVCAVAIPIVQTLGG